MKKVERQVYFSTFGVKIPSNPNLRRLTMEEKKGFSRQLSDFFAGKGFYIVLLLCAGLVAVSIWLTASGKRTDVETRNEEIHAETAGISIAEEEEPDAIAVMGSTALRPRTDHAGVVPDVREPELPEPEAPRTESAPAESAHQGADPVQSVDYFIWPVNGRLLRGYDLETLSYDPTMRDWRLHTGWDIAAAPGEPVLSTANGVISAVYDDPLMGTTVEVSHSNGLVSVYSNLNREPAVFPGQSVAVGSVLGSVGSTGLAESGQDSHLHFAMRTENGAADPAQWLPSQD